MLSYFPKYFTSNSVYLYFGSLIIVNLLFFSKLLPLIWWLFGIVEVLLFFYYSNVLTKRWENISPKLFVKKLFVVALLLRLFWVLFSFVFYQQMNGTPFEFGAADAKGYHELAIWLGKSESLGEAWQRLVEFQRGGVSDTGYAFYLINLYRVFGEGLLLPRLIKAILGAVMCIHIYRLATRNFGEEVGRMAAIFCMLMPNLIYYAGMHLKEAEMVFLTVWFVERADNLLRNKNYTFITILPPLVLAVSLFFFRTVLGATALFAILTALLFSSGKVVSWAKRLIVGIWVLAAIAYFVGGRIANEVEEVWQGRLSNQETSLEWRSNREGGNELARLASSAIFIPTIFALPFPTMINTPGQENQQLIHGGNFVKNIMSFFALFALYFILKNKSWRQYTFVGSFMLGYLLVIALSAFAHSERFHQPAIPFILMFAAYGVSKISNKEKKWFLGYLMLLFIINIVWSWYKLAGRGLI